MTDRLNNAVDTGQKSADGRSIFELRHTIMAESRQIQATQNTKKKAVENSDESDQPDVPVSESALVRQKWRILSKVKAWPNTGYGEPQLVDYTSADDTVMEKMVGAIVVKPDLRWDHSYSIKDVVGWIEDAEWEAESEIPAGVNAWVVADPEYDAKAAIGLRKGIIRSGSVGISARMVRSHNEMDMNVFLRSQGKIIDGEEVRWIPVDITDVEHMALVPYRLGADPNAGARYAGPVSASNSVIPDREITNLNKEPLERLDGGQKMTNWEEMFGEVCNVLGVDLKVDGDINANNAMITVNTKLNNLKESHRILIALQTGLYDCEKYVIREEETGLKSEEIVRRLPEMLHFAKQGQAFLAFQKTEALKWFDVATVKPDVELSVNDRKIRNRISGSTDLDFIEEQLNLYREISNSRFGPVKSSVSEEIPKETKGGSVPDESVESVNRVFGGE